MSRSFLKEEGKRKVQVVEIAHAKSRSTQSMPEMARSREAWEVWGNRRKVD